MTLLESWLKDLRTRPDRNQDALVLVVGPTGAGKSAAAWWIGHAVDPVFMNKRMHFSGASFVADVMRQSRGRVVVLDESDDGLDSRASSSEKNRITTSYFERCRIRGILAFACKPHLHWFDRKVREDRSHYLVYVPRRGRAVVHRPRRHNGSGDVVPHQAEGTRWRPLFAFDFPDPTPYKDWSYYLERKEAHSDSFDTKPSGRKKRK